MKYNPKKDLGHFILGSCRDKSPPCSREFICRMSGNPKLCLSQSQVVSQKKNQYCSFSVFILMTTSAIFYACIVDSINWQFFSVVQSYRTSLKGMKSQVGKHPVCKPYGFYSVSVNQGRTQSILNRDCCHSCSLPCAMKCTVFWNQK